jgi:DMSO/TMAO reductase YedYZ molybdopterin-dependent catalytic subunit
MAKEIPPELADRVPPGQVLTDKWPVLTYGATPRFDPATWRFRCFGLVERPVEWTWPEFQALPRSEVACDIHCVTHWSRLGNRFGGVHIRDIMACVRLQPGASHVLVHADPEYTTNLALGELVDDDVILALEHDGRPLTADHGGPVRLVVPKLYFWKSAKWVRGLEFLDVNQPGFWEENGYHMRADPWREERYSDQETRAMQEMRAAAARRLGGR